MLITAAKFIELILQKQDTTLKTKDISKNIICCNFCTFFCNLQKQDTTFKTKDI